MGSVRGLPYNDTNIFIKYFVAEQSIRAVTEHMNGPVWEDSCVEFFISFDEAGYYNLEFNCLGVALVGFGKNRGDRQLIAEEKVRMVKTMSWIQKTNNASIYWELVLCIPSSVFVHHCIANLKGKECKVNFYKCGDLLPTPHFISWSPINSHIPDFHLLQYFGILIFE